MNRAVAARLCKINSDFYRSNAVSFSQTRGAAWAGWERAAQAIEAACEGSAAGAARGALPLIADVACGNGRFEAFCAQRWGTGACEIVALDNCIPLASAPLAARPYTVFRACDITAALLAGTADEALRTALDERSADAAVCFGFFHHVPGETLRAALLRALVCAVRPGGCVIASFWRFMDDERLARKARTDDERARAYFGAEAFLDGGGGCALEPGDHLLGWQNLPGAFRYCHSFTISELERLCASVADCAQLTGAYDADGASGALNRYLVFTRL